jgi:hypothetical protein
LQHGLLFKEVLKMLRNEKKKPGLLNNTTHDPRLFSLDSITFKCTQ